VAVGFHYSTWNCAIICCCCSAASFCGSASISIFENSPWSCSIFASRAYKFIFTIIILISLNFISEVLELESGTNKSNEISPFTPFFVIHTWTLLVNIIATKSINDWKSNRNYFCCFMQLSHRMAAEELETAYVICVVLKVYSCW
jgi:hypothetical protein